MTATFDAVPWPENFSMYTVALQLFNADVLDFLPGTIEGGCVFRLEYTQKFLLHMTIPFGLFIFAWFAYKIAGFLRRGNSNIVLLQREWYTKIVISLILLIYPGLTVRIFQMFKCYSVPDYGFVLHQSFSVKCYEDYHIMYVLLGLLAMVLYVFGIPFAIFLVLRKNLDALYDKNHPKHLEVAMEYGSLYIQYESKYWFWELIVISEKAILTGGMVLVAPGTSLQLLIAVVTTLGFFGAVIKFRPYYDEADDSLSSLTHLQILLTLLGGLALLTDHDDPKDKIYSPSAMGYFGIILNSLSWFILLIMIIMLHPKFRKKTQRRKNTKNNGLLAVLSLINKSHHQKKKQFTSSHPSYEFSDSNNSSSGDEDENELHATEDDIDELKVWGR